MMQGLHDDDGGTRFVCTIIQKRQLLSVNWLLQKPLPPRTTLLRTGGKLLQVGVMTFF